MALQHADRIDFLGHGAGSTFSLIGVAPRSGVLRSARIALSAATSGSGASDLWSVKIINKGQAGAGTVEVVDERLTYHDSAADEFAAFTSEELDIDTTNDAIVAGDTLELRFTATGTPTDLSTATIAAYLYVG